jgi:hypothetical protein
MERVIYTAPAESTSTPNGRRAPAVRKPNRQEKAGAQFTEIAITGKTNATTFNFRLIFPPLRAREGGAALEAWLTAHGYM